MVGHLEAKLSLLPGAVAFPAAAGTTVETRRRHLLLPKSCWSRGSTFSSSYQQCIPVHTHGIIIANISTDSYARSGGPTYYWVGARVPLSSIEPHEDDNFAVRFVLSVVSTELNVFVLSGYTISLQRSRACSYSLRLSSDEVATREVQKHSDE